MVERDEGMRLAAAKVRLQLDDRIATFAAQPARRVHQQVPKALGEERPAEELLRLAVLVLRLVTPHLMQVGGELGLLILARRDVPMRRDDLPPRLQIRARHSLERLSRLT